VRKEETTCCIVGGGTARLVAGLLLSRQSADVLVLEKHGDFLRDFRGDSTRTRVNRGKERGPPPICDSCPQADWMRPMTLPSASFTEAISCPHRHP
jgi:predicted flavoprotein YhiN